MPHADPRSARNGRGRLVSSPVATPSLDQLRPGGRGRITRIDGEDGLVQRLMEMGLLEGEEVEVIGFAPMGDPMEVRLGDYRLSLRRVEAARVHVEPL
jgi:ferrous iron transport protein A